MLLATVLPLAASWVGVYGGGSRVEGDAVHVDASLASAGGDSSPILTPSRREPTGTPEPLPDPTGRIAVVHFAFDARRPRRPAAREVERAFGLVRDLPRTAIVAVVGHADSRGGTVYNENLARARAANIASLLRARLGRASPRLELRAFGKRRPVVPNRHPNGSDDPAGRARNRRVVVRVVRRD